MLERVGLELLVVARGSAPGCRSATAPPCRRRGRPGVRAGASSSVDGLGGSAPSPAADSPLRCRRCSRPCSSALPPCRGARLAASSSRRRQAQHEQHGDDRRAISADDQPAPADTGAPRASSGLRRSVSTGSASPTASAARLLERRAVLVDQHLGVEAEQRRRRCAGSRARRRGRAAPPSPRSPARAGSGCGSSSAPRPPRCRCPWRVRSCLSAAPISDAGRRRAGIAIARPLLSRGACRSQSPAAPPSAPTGSGSASCAPSRSRSSRRPRAARARAAARPRRPAPGAASSPRSRRSRRGARACRSAARRACSRRAGAAGSSRPTRSGSRRRCRTASASRSSSSGEISPLASPPRPRRGDSSSSSSNSGSPWLGPVLGDLGDLLLGHEGALDALQLRGAGGAEEHVALAEQRLGAALVEDHARVDLGGDGERDPGRDVDLDRAGDHVGRGALGREHEVDADRARLLRQADDRVLDLGRARPSSGRRARRSRRGCAAAAPRRALRRTGSAPTRLRARASPMTS